MKQLKYKNSKCEYKGIRFDSKKERDRYIYLKSLEDSGKIAKLELQPKYDLIVNGHKVCTYSADFRYIEPYNGGENVVITEDVKSTVTAKNPVYRLKKKLMLACHGIEIKET